MVIRYRFAMDLWLSGVADAGFAIWITSLVIILTPLSSLFSSFLFTMYRYISKDMHGMD